MEKTRLEMLKDAMRAAPENAFLQYGLAMELKSAGRDAEAWEQFQGLLARHPDYSAAYYQAGTLLAKLGRREEARQVLTKGLEVTATQNNAHAQSELQAALDELVE